MEKNRPKKNKRTPTICRICASPALYSYLGVIVCPSCKMFFKRHALDSKRKFTCLFNNDCRINRQTNELCPSCRLKKCFNSGMQVKMLRASTAKAGRTYPKETPTSFVHESRTIQKNLLRSNQWSLLTNLIRSYDDCQRYSSFEQCLQRQNQLPVKMRYKSEQLTTMINTLMWSGQNLYEKNAYFITLPSSIQLFLIEKTAAQVMELNTVFLLRTYRMYEDYVWYEMIATIYGRIIVDNHRLVNRVLDSDSIFVKLVTAILMFSPLEFPSDHNDAHWMMRKILKIQDMYVELAWRYMASKYSDDRAVSSFSNLIRTLFTLKSSTDTQFNMNKICI